jgi:hypothetical protein
MCERSFSPSSSASSRRLGIDSAPSGPAIAPPWRRSCPCPLRSARRVSPRPRSAGARPRRRPPPKRGRSRWSCSRARPRRRREAGGSASRRSAPAPVMAMARGAVEFGPSAGCGHRPRFWHFPAPTANVILYRPRQGGLFCRTDRADVERIESSSTPSRNRRPCAVGGPPIRPGRSRNSSATMPMRRCGCLDRRAVSPMLARRLP